MLKIPELRNYQIEAVDLLKGEFKKLIKIVLLCLSGGGGKTVIAGYMIDEAQKKGNPVLFIAHRKELIKQAQKKFAEFGIEAGIIMAGERPSPFKLVQIASIQTLQRRELPPAKFIMVDECHRSISPQYLEILKFYESQGAYIVGLTGTPFRTNKREGLNILYQSYVANIKSSMLIEQGYVCPAKVYDSGKISSKKMKSKAGEFREDELMKAFDTQNAYVNLVANIKKYLSGKKIIIFCCSVPHSIKCTEVLLNEGFRAMHIDGNTPDKQRDDIVAMFRGPDLDILVNYGIAIEGLDVPICQGTVLAFATKSKTKYFQASWRANRPFPGKEFYIVLDMADNCERFGFPDEDIEVSLEAEDDTESSGVAPVKVCPSCSYMNHASCMCCPDCKHEFKKEVKKINEEEFIELQRDSKERKWKNYTQKDWYKVKDEDLPEFAKLKKYPAFWVTKQLEARKDGRKIAKIKDFPGTKQEYYKKIKELENAYYAKKAIDATEYVFLEENKAYVVFQYVKKPVEIINDSEAI